MSLPTGRGHALVMLLAVAFPAPAWPQGAAPAGWRRELDGTTLRRDG